MPSSVFLADLVTTTSCTQITCAWLSPQVPELDCWGSYVICTLVCICSITVGLWPSLTGFDSRILTGLCYSGRTSYISVYRCTLKHQGHAGVQVQLLCLRSRAPVFHCPLRTLFRSLKIFEHSVCLNAPHMTILSLGYKGLKIDFDCQKIGTGFFPAWILVHVQLYEHLIASLQLPVLCYKLYPSRKIILYQFIECLFGRTC